jgi:hypothetical protein
VVRVHSALKANEKIVRGNRCVNSRRGPEASKKGATTPDRGLCHIVPFDGNQFSCHIELFPLYVVTSLAVTNANSCFDPATRLVHPELCRCSSQMKAVRTVADPATWENRESAEINHEAKKGRGVLWVGPAGNPCELIIISRQGKAHVQPPVSV